MGRIREPGQARMPAAARSAALATFAQVVRERHPGLTVLPVQPTARRRRVPAAGGEVVWPFARREDVEALVDRHLGLGA